MSVVLLFTLHSMSLTLHAPVELELDIRNDSEEAVVVDLGQDRKSALSFDLETPDGRKLHLPSLSPEGLGRMGRIRLGPHSHHKQTYVLNEWYAFRAAGQYVLGSALTTPVLSESGALVKSEASPPRITFSVSPPDSHRLSAVCSALLEKLRKTSDREEIAEASLKLSYVVDPLAVPYIKQGLSERKLMWQYAIPGLARIADEQAVNLLIALMATGDDEQGAALAKFHLKELAPTAEPELRKKIERSLAQSK